MKRIGKWFNYCLLFTIIILSLSACSCDGTVPNDGSTLQIQEEANEEFDNNAGRLELELIGYENSVKRFIVIDPACIDDVIENKSPLVLITGRPTCEWCRLLIPMLEEHLSREGITAYYLDSTNTDTDSRISIFREEHGIKTVPCVLVFRNAREAITVDIDLEADDLSVEIASAIAEIKSLIQDV